jgi:zinc-binding in reverse transcriptase
LFWIDRWKYEYSLAYKYPLLFSVSTNPNITVSQIFLTGHMQLSFNRQLVGLYFQEWCELEFEFRNFVLNSNGKNILMWRWLEYGGFKNIKFSILWKINIPLKIFFFVWLVRRNRVLTKTNLRKKGWNENT